jgi:BirA family biotin operon repressor/biotin-[acetyl-CoA-carboxylase] ligase
LQTQPLSRNSKSPDVNSSNPWFFIKFKENLNKGIPLNISTTSGFRDGIIEYFESIPSTNEYLVQNPHIPSNTLVIANHQSSGHGRHNRVWVSPPNKNLYFSLFLKPIIPLHLWPPISQVAAISMVKTLVQYGLEPQLKWPNDILIQSHKICGILAKIGGEEEDRKLILGIGLNVNSRLEDFSGLDRKACSMLMVKGQEFDRAIILNEFLKAFDCDLNLFETKGLKPFLEYWKSMENFVGAPARIVQENQELSGTIEAINDDGSLNFRTTAGELKKILSGDLEV